MARNLTRLIVTQIDFSLITEPDFRTNFINGSHEPVICSFIHYFLNGFSQAKNIPWQGNTLNYAEGFEIKVFEAKTDYRIEFSFRDDSRPIDLRWLKQFISQE